MTWAQLSLDAGDDRTHAQVARSGQLREHALDRRDKVRAQRRLIVVLGARRVAAPAAPRPLFRRRAILRRRRRTAAVCTRVRIGRQVREKGGAEVRGETVEGDELDAWVGVKPGPEGEQDRHELFGRAGGDEVDAVAGLTGELRIALALDEGGGMDGAGGEVALGV